MDPKEPPPANEERKSVDPELPGVDPEPGTAAEHTG